MSSLDPRRKFERLLIAVIIAVIIAGANIDDYAAQRRSNNFVTKPRGLDSTNIYLPTVRAKYVVSTFLILEG